MFGVFRKYSLKNSVIFSQNIDFFYRDFIHIDMPNAQKHCQSSNEGVPSLANNHHQLN